MLFSQVIGQQQTKEHLVQTVKENRISHAQLFAGQPGYGGLPLALAYAQFVLCENPGEQDACGQCAACKKVQKLQHPDLHFSFPTAGSKSGTPYISDDFIVSWREFLLDNPYGSYEQWMAKMDAGNSQGLIKVREAAQIVKKLSLKSFESDYKVLILWYPEKMNAETANKLLKLIEEPPALTLFLLVSEQPDLIINTILSRTQLLKIPRIQDEAMAQGLIRQFTLPNERAQHISRMCEGDMQRAMELIETSEEAQQSFDAFTQMMRLSYMGKMPDLIQWVDGIARWGRERQRSLLQYSLKMVRENLVINQKQKDLARLSDAEHGFAAKFSGFIHPENAFLIAAEFDLAIKHIVRNANAKVVFLDLCIQLNRMLKIPA